MATQDTAESTALATATHPADEAPKELKSEETPKEEAKEEPAKDSAENATPEEPPAPAETSAATGEAPGAATEEVAATGPVEGSLPSFKEESYFEKDLKESEKKALQEFLEIVETAIKAKEFVLPTKVEVVKETTEVVKAGDDAVLVASTVEKEIKEGDLEVKVEEAAVAVIAAEDVAEEAKSLEGATTESSAPSTESPVPAEATAPAATETPAEATIPPAPEATEEALKSEEKKSDEAPKSDEKKSDEAPKSEDKKSEGPAESPATTTTTVEIPSSAAEAPATEAELAPAVVETTELIVEEKDLAPPEELELWGVPLLPSKGDPRTKVIFLKFLRARDFKVKEAFTMLKNCILWRKRYGTDQILEEDLGTEFDSCAFNHGVDKEGHPVQYNVFGVFQDKDFYQKVFGDPSKTEKALRWRVQLLEKQIQLLNFNPGGVTSILQVVDLKNAPLLGKKGLRLFMSQALKLLTDNYPELVVKIVFLNTPWYFNAIYAFLSPFSTQRMKSKYTIASSLFKFISPDNIPVQYGGLSRINDAEFGDANASVTELVLKPGEKKTAEIEVSGGEVIVWEVALVGSDVTYGAEFVPSKEGGYTTIVEKPKKITLLEEPLRNSFKSPEAGKLVLSIDNSLSRKKKTALYRYIKKTTDVHAAE